MTVKNISNLAASVQARLQNHARASKRPFQELLQYYAMERFLYRLSTTSHRARFVLKGALMLHVWEAPLARATKDVDFLGRLDNSLENLERVVREVCTADVEPDGLVFDSGTVKTERIKEDADYEGVRVRFVGLLGKARITMQLDVGSATSSRPVHRAGVDRGAVDRVPKEAPEHGVPGDARRGRTVPSGVPAAHRARLRRRPELRAKLAAGRAMDPRTLSCSRRRQTQQSEAP